MTSLHSPPSYAVFVLSGSRLLVSRLIRTLQTMDGFRLMGHAKDGVSGLLAIQRDRPDAVLYELPACRPLPLDVLSALRAQDAPPQVIALTDSMALAVRQACLTAGATHCFDKTLEYDRLRATLYGLRMEKQRGRLSAR